MKKDFQIIKEQLPPILQVASDFYQRPKRRGSCYFVKSPVSHDKTWSLALYPVSNSYCDFSQGNRSGDSISLISYVKGVDNWQALKILKDFYGLQDSRELDRQETRRRILAQQEQERKNRQRQQAFKVALLSCIDDLRRWEDICRLTMEKAVFEPFNDMWCYVMNELQRTEYRLDILCGSNQTEYRFMKYSDRVPSNRPQWLLDVLAILAENGAFQATQRELAEIQKQRDFELTKQPGAERRCNVGW